MNHSGKSGKRNIPAYLARILAMGICLLISGADLWAEHTAVPDKDNRPVNIRQRSRTEQDTLYFPTNPTKLAQGENERESLFPKSSRSLAFSHFTWGVDLGSSIDLDGNDMSTFDIDAVLGYKNRLLRIAGVGVGVHRNFGNSNTFIPIYALLRTSFRTQPSRFFMNLRAGYSFNTLADSPTFGDVSAALGAGINLAMSQRFASHIILSYGYRHFSLRNRELTGLHAKNNHIAQVIFGVNF